MAAEEEIARFKREPALQQGNSVDPNWACWCCPAHENYSLAVYSLDLRIVDLKIHSPVWESGRL